MSSSVISGERGVEPREPPGFLRFDLLLDHLEDPLQLGVRLPHAEADEPERRALVEDDHQDDPLPHDGDVDVVALPLVEQDGELPLADEAGEPVGGGHVSGRERGEGGRVERLHVPLRRDLLPVLVDDEDDFRLGIRLQTRDDVLDLAELLVEQDEIRHGKRRGQV